MKHQCPITPILDANCPYPLGVCPVCHTNNMSLELDRHGTLVLQSHHALHERDLPLCEGTGQIPQWIYKETWPMD